MITRLNYLYLFKTIFGDYIILSIQGLIIHSKTIEPFDFRFKWINIFKRIIHTLISLL